MANDAPPRASYTPQPTFEAGFRGWGQRAVTGEIHAKGARLSNRWQVVASALSSDPDRVARLQDQMEIGML